MFRVQDLLTRSRQEFGCSGWGRERLSYGGRRVSLSQAPVMDVLDPVILVVPLVSRQGDNPVERVEVSVVFTPLKIQAGLIEDRKSLAQCRPEAVAPPDRGDRSGG